MTRALSSRSSKRRNAKSSQESIPDVYKETSPTVLSQSSQQRRTKSKPKCPTASKENQIPKGTSRTIKSSQSSEENSLHPLRKSVRQMNISSNYQLETKNLQIERKVLCDKTNYSSFVTVNDKNCNVLKSIHNKDLTSNELNSASKTLTLNQRKNKIPNLSDDCITTNHIPVYNKIDDAQVSSVCPKTFQSEKTEAVYEFEIDENEEPKQAKKRKKRVYTKKPKIGPKALTINNIKYSSCESLVSLPERPIARKKRTITNGQKKTCSSVTSINDTVSTTCSVKSFISHPANLLECQSENQWPKKNLSILHETQSEQLQSPIHGVNTDLLNSSINMNHNQNSSQSMNSVVPNNLDRSSVHKIYPSPKHKLYDSSAPNSTVDMQHYSNPTNVNETIPQHSLSGPGDISKVSQDFLSSTPCKRVSLVVCDNSVFDDSYDLPQNLRPSTGFIKNSSGTSITKDSCFGFDEPEELEEPLVSPIKKDDHNKKSKRPMYLIHQQHQKEPLEKPSINEVIQMLKATVPKTSKETKDGDSDSINNSPSTSPTRSNKDIQVNFRKPPRRSYERQRRVRYVEESEEESEPEIAQEEFQERQTHLEKSPKEVKKCYKKGNASKSAKSKKGRKKGAKEEEEMDRLAALMNAQFQKIEKVDLVVE